MSSIITGREVTATMSSNQINRFKVVYHLGTAYKPKKFLFSVRPEENIQTISDFKIVLAEMFRLSPHFKLDIYLDGFALLDWTQLTTIKDNETIEVRSGQSSQEDDQRSDSPGVVVIDQIKPEPNIFELTPSSSSTSSAPNIVWSLDQISPPIDLSDFRRHSLDDSLDDSLNPQSDQNWDNNSSDETQSTITEVYYSSTIDTLIRVAPNSEPKSRQQTAKKTSKPTDRTERVDNWVDTPKRKSQRVRKVKILSEDYYFY